MLAAPLGERSPLMYGRKGLDMAYYSALYIRKLKSGKWQGYCYYRNQDGERKQTTYLSQERLKRDARPQIEKWYADLCEAAEKAGAANSNEMTVKDAVEEYIERQLLSGAFEKSTAFTYKKAMRNRLAPFSIANCGFTTLTAMQVDAWLTELYGRGYAGSSVRVIYSLVKSTYTDAYRKGVIDDNPFWRIKTPKNGKVTPSRLTAAQTNDFNFAVAGNLEIGSWFYTAIGLVEFSGMRVGEVCGLRWRDVDFEAGIINITTSIGRSDEGTYTKGPKSNAGYRQIPLMYQLREFLIERLENLGETADTIDGSWFVIGDEDKHRWPTTVSTYFRNFRNALGLVDAYGKPLTLRNLRHNFGTLAVTSKVDIKSVQRLLGHSSAAMTLDIYASADEDAIRLASEKVEDAFSNRTEIYSNFSWTPDNSEQLPR